MKNKFYDDNTYLKVVALWKLSKQSIIDKEALELGDMVINAQRPTYNQLQMLENIIVSAERAPLDEKFLKFSGAIQKNI